MKTCRLLLLLPIGLAMLFSCEHQPVARSVNNNYLLSWRRDTNYLLLQNFAVDTPTKNTLPYIEATGSVAGKFTVRHLTDAPELLMAVGQPIPAAESYYSTHKSHPAFWEKPFKPDSSIYFKVNYMSADTAMAVKLSCVKAQRVNYYNQD
jgi:hypothetical protein